MTENLPTFHPGGDPDRYRLIDARLHLLDRQILDLGGRPVATVDDLELDDPEPGGAAPTVRALLTGASLFVRIFGGAMPRRRLQTIAWSTVRRVGITVGIDVDIDELDAAWTERWVEEQIIARIPGGRHASE